MALSDKVQQVSSSYRVKNAVRVLSGAFLVVLVEMCRQFSTRTYRFFGFYDLLDPDWTLYGGSAFLLVVGFTIWLLTRRKPS